MWQGRLIDWWWLAGCLLVSMIDANKIYHRWVSPFKTIATARKQALEKKMIFFSIKNQSLLR